MKLLLPALALLITSWNCQAAIGNGNNPLLGTPTNYANGKPIANNPELFFVAFDHEGKVSYTLDLGLDVDSFWINAQQDAGMQWFKPLGDANWDSFMADASRERLRWTVLGADTFGSNAPHALRLYTTVTQGKEAVLRDWNNQQFSNAVQRIGQIFIPPVNQAGTHASTPAGDMTVNGSNVGKPTDPSLTYFGKKPSGSYLDETLGGFATGFTVGNSIGQSSWFYYLTRSGTSQLGKVTVDEFDNLGADGYWGFTYVDPATNSPYAGQYLLSYTMEKAGATASTAEGRQRISMTDYLALNRLAPPRYFAASSALAAEYAGYRQGSLVVVAGSMVSAVPEPASWGLMGLGLGLLAARRRRAARQL